MTRHSNLSIKKSKAYFVHWGGALSYICQRAEQLRYLMQSGSNNFLKQIEVGNSIDFQERHAQLSHSVNNWDEDHHLLIISIIRFTNVMRVFVSPNSIILPVWLLVKAKEFFACPHDFLNDFWRLLKNALAKLPPLWFLSICQWLNWRATVDFFLPSSFLRIFHNGVLVQKTFGEDFRSKVLGYSCTKFFTFSIASSVLFGFVFVGFCFWIDRNSWKWSCTHEVIQLIRLRSPSSNL